MIKYEKTTWVDGETVLKADHMKKIEKGIVDLCTEIENITLEGADLSNYYTKGQTDNKISEEIAKAQLGGGSEVDLSAYATKTYVDNEISKIELKEGPQGPQGERGPQGETPSIAHLETIISNKISEVDELIHQLTNNRIVDGGELDGNIDDVIIKVDGVYLNTTSHTFDDFTTLQLTANILPTDATNKNVIWRSYNSDIATVNDEGLVTAISNGSTNITVTTEDGNYTATCNITVNKVIEEIPPTQTSIVVNQSSYTVSQGKDLSLDVTISNLPEYAVFELRRNGEYLCHALKENDTTITGQTSYLSPDTYSNVTLVIKVYQSDTGYVDIATSNPITITVAGSSSGGGSTVPVTSISVSPTSKSASVGETFSITTSILPTNATNQSVTWYSNNSSVARVSEGTVYCDSVGSATITATTVDGYKTASCNVTVSNSSSGGGSGSLSEYEMSCTPEYILDKMYPMGQNHEAIPNGNIVVSDGVNWKYQSKWENQNRPYAMSHSCGQSGCPNTGLFQALGAWSNVYRVEGTPFTQNTGVEMKDMKVYGWYNGSWELVQHLPVPNGNFYAESFNGDSNQNFLDSIKQTSTSKTVILRETNKVNSENCMYHPFTNIKAFDTKYQYIYTCIDLRKVKWDENGIDDRDQTHYCSNCGGDWWLKEGLMWHDSWQHNKGVAQPKMIEITNEWRRFSMTTVPEGWSNGFPR